MLALLPLLMGVLSAAPQPRPAAQEPRPAVAWQRTLADALAVQAATGLPLLVVVNMDGEVFNDRFAKDVYRDPAFVAKSADYVCVVASPDRHSERDYDALGNRIECPRFGGCTCSEHIHIEPELYARYFGGKRNAPRHVGVSPQGEVLFDRYLDRSMQTAIDAIEQHRGAPSAAHLTPTEDLAVLFSRRDAMARALLERRYRRGDAAQRAALLERAATASNEPIDLLRMGLRDDAALAKRAAVALSQVGGVDARIDIEDALAIVDDDDVRAALIARLRALGARDRGAARLAAHLDRAAAPLPAPWRNEWSDDAFAADRGSIEAELDAVEGALREAPADQPLRLRLAIGYAAFALHLVAAGGDGVELWFADAQRHAARVTDEALRPEARAVAAIAAWHRGDGEAAAKAIVEALAAGASERAPSAWLARRFLEVALQVTARTAYDRTRQDEQANLAAEVERALSILDQLQRAGGGDVDKVLTGIGLLEFAGRRAEARARLAAVVREHPGSLEAHNRWRDSVLVDLGADGLRGEYARFVDGAADRATAQWYAGYAALVAGDRHTADDRGERAEAAYADAIERFADSAARNEAYADTANHYAVLALAGRAELRRARADRRGAVADLQRAAALRPASLDTEDGLGRTPRAVARRVQRAAQEAGDGALAAELDPIVK